MGLGIWKNGRHQPITPYHKSWADTINRVKEHDMLHAVPAHKSGTAGQIVTPPVVNHDMMDDMGKYADQERHAPTSKTYKPTHGGYPTPAPISTDAKRI
jgi:hypothetical protein